MLFQIQVVVALALLGTAFGQRPNFIVMQPDDMEFFEPWIPPPHADNEPAFAFPASSLPHLERLRQGSVQMTQAYTASSSCAPSRFSTITGRYASRSGFSRALSANEDVTEVTVPTTRIEDASDQCTEGNVATLLQKNGYRTGIVGKWHLSDVPRNAAFSYSDFQERVRQCGFDSVEAINFGGDLRDVTYSHNLEYLAEKAIEFISASDDPFFLYINPTAPHEQASVMEALTDFDCTDTPAGRLDSEPQVPGMTAGTTCAAYRQTIIDRANGAVDNNSLGSIWVDDVVGSILQVLEDRDQLDNTFFMFHLDHGQEGKGTLWEQGLRIPKFVHFPQVFPDGKVFDGLISTIDTAPTILDYAGVTEDSPGYYEMDGRSWRNSVETSSSDGDRCVYFEIGQDRAVRCGCYKYMYIHDASASTSMRRAERFGMASTSRDGGELLFDLCDQDGVYESTDNKEAVAASNSGELTKLSEISSCLRSETFPTTLPEYLDCGLNPEPAVSLPPGACFSGMTTLQRADGSLLRMKDARIGDVVKVEEGIFEPIYSFGHFSDSSVTSFVHFHPSGLEVTPSHLVFVNGKRSPLPASMVQVGDSLSGVQVTKITTGARKGLFAPFTPSGKLVVNNVVVSAYIAVQEDSAFVNVMGGDTDWFSQHWLSHAFLVPHRLVCYHMWSCSKELSPEGIPVWAYRPLKAAKWILNQHPSVQATVFIPMFGVLHVLHLLEQCFWTILLVGASLWFWRSSARKIASN